MKTLLLIATVAAAAVTFTAPLNAAPVSGISLAQVMDGSFDRHGRGGGCDTPRDIREHPRCQ